MSFFLMLKLMRSTKTAETTGPFFYYLPISQYFRELYLNLNGDTMAALSDESMNPAVAAEWIKMTEIWNFHLWTNFLLAKVCDLQLNFT